MATFYLGYYQDTMDGVGAAARLGGQRDGHFHSLTQGLSLVVDTSTVTIPSLLVLQEEELNLGRSLDEAGLVLHSLKRLEELEVTRSDLEQCDLVSILFTAIYPKLCN